MSVEIMQEEEPLWNFARMNPISRILVRRFLDDEYDDFEIIATNECEAEFLIYEHSVDNLIQKEDFPEAGLYYVYGRVMIETSKGHYNEYPEPEWYWGAIKIIKITEEQFDKIERKWGKMRQNQFYCYFDEDRDEGVKFESEYSTLAAIKFAETAFHHFDLWERGMDCHLEQIWNDKGDVVCVEDMKTKEVEKFKITIEFTPNFNAKYIEDEES